MGGGKFLTKHKISSKKKIFPNFVLKNESYLYLCGVN